MRQDPARYRMAARSLLRCSIRRFQRAGNAVPAIRRALLALGIAAGSAAAQSQSGGQPSALNLGFGGHYAQLTPRQRELVDDWFQRFNQAQDTNLHPEVAYDEMPITARTTFEAVTHALANSMLTSQAGAPMGTALDLIEKVDQVKGKIPGARGDLQFRIYVQLKSNTIAMLDEAQEFTRRHDNTVFHKSYPLNYRQGSGAPSIQFSMTRDGRYADIDVDYRSSFFAVAAFDGHLTSANSDVRAGNNVHRHNHRWSGFSNWWQNLLGIGGSEAAAGTTVLATGLPRKGKGHLDEAVHDYLSSWLVDGQPRESLAYASEEAFDCAARESGLPVDRTVAMARKFNDMEAASEALGGRVKQLSDVVTPQEIQDHRLIPVKQRYRQLFSIASIPPTVGSDYSCAEVHAASKKSHKSEVGYSKETSGRYAVSFSLHASGRSGFPVIQIWFKDAGIWRIEAFRLQADPNWAAVPDVSPDVEESAEDVIKIAGDPAVIQATTSFLEDWFVKHDVDAAMTYMGEASLVCAGVDSTGQASPAVTNLREQVRVVLAGIASSVGPSTTLAGALQSVATTSSQIRLVMHPNQDAFSILALPDNIGATMNCRSEWSDRDRPSPADQDFGNHYLTTFRRRDAGEDSAVLKLHWAKEGGAWRIMSYYVLGE